MIKPNIKNGWIAIVDWFRAMQDLSYTKAEDEVGHLPLPDNYEKIQQGLFDEISVKTGTGAVPGVSIKPAGIVAGDDLTDHTDVDSDGVSVYSATAQSSLDSTALEFSTAGSEALSQSSSSSVTGSTLHRDWKSSSTAGLSEGTDIRTSLATGDRIESTDRTIDTVDIEHSITTITRLSLEDDKITIYKKVVTASVDEDGNDIAGSEVINSEKTLTIDSSSVSGDIDFSGAISVGALKTTGTFNELVTDKAEDFNLYDIVGVINDRLVIYNNTINSITYTKLGRTSNSASSTATIDPYSYKTFICKYVFPAGDGLPIRYFWASVSA